VTLKTELLRDEVQKAEQQDRAKKLGVANPRPIAPERGVSARHALEDSFGRGVRRTRAVLGAGLLGTGLLATGLLGACQLPAAAPSEPIAGVTVGAPCRDGRCAEGLSCHHEDPAGDLHDRCLLEPGRCRSEWDCARGAQRCMRFGEALGVCQDSGL
jgi:hypothetical protein